MTRLELVSKDMNLTVAYIQGTGRDNFMCLLMDRADDFFITRSLVSCMMTPLSQELKKITKNFSSINETAL